MFSLVKSYSIFNRNISLLILRHTCFVAIRPFSNSNTFYNKKLEEQNKIVRKDVISPALNAFAARMRLNFSDPKILLQAVTHKSFTDTNLPSNKRFKELGKCAIQLYITEYFHIKYPLLHTNYLKDVVNIYSRDGTLSTFGHEIGLNYVVRWNESTDLYTSSTATNDEDQLGPTDENESPVLYESRKTTVKIGHVVARAVQAIVGALYLVKGPNSAQKFVQDHLLSRDLNVQQQYDVKEPKRHLSALMKRLGQEPPVSRLLYEAGRLTKEPIFVIGIYSGTKKLAEGFGSSLKMAEFRAAKNALLNHYFKEIKDFTLPSTIDIYQKQMSYIPTKVCDTPATV
ncbi:ribonuclease III domain-containing protein [Glomus cerebriforme]|uniref:Large ribosomal subunit protein mL44 n=1 Tax=Glomus cerebriforme TaxID=658196 RepID=A0A397TF65_9GLOM|nr:ribonuclease III domain-containing protein [Glomus cerebriforme]